MDAGNTVVVTEHNMDVTKTADWIIDLGSEGGESGGRIVAEGSQEAVVEAENSHTGRFLGETLTSTCRSKREYAGRRQGNIQSSCAPRRAVFNLARGAADPEWLERSR